jgi:hypothetical protein
MRDCLVGRFDGPTEPAGGSIVNAGSFLAEMGAATARVGVSACT